MRLHPIGYGRDKHMPDADISTVEHADLQVLTRSGSAPVQRLHAADQGQTLVMGRDS